MAITGSGTEQDPWIVHSYDEIKSCISSIDSSYSYGPYYLELANDINCNDYGADFVWETVKHTNSSVKWNFDLKGHTIKNVLIKTGSYLMFQGGTTGGNYNCYIRNGKILNVFVQDADMFFKSMAFENVSFSGNASMLRTDRCFSGCGFTNSAIYVESSNLGSSSKRIFDNSPTKIDNSDIMLKIENCDRTGPVFLNRGTNETVSCSNSRIRGYITGNATITSQNSRIITNIIPTNCVIDLVVNGYELSDSISTTQAILDSPTTVINDGAILPWMTVGATIAAPSGEAMRSSSALNALGFTVIPVTE